MERISQINPIETLAQINKNGLTQTVLALAKKFLPDTCAYRLGNLFGFNVLVAISKQLLIDREVNDLKQICRSCEHLRLCEFWRRN